MLSKLKERLKEPSTALGLGQVITGIGLVTDFDEAPQIADTVTNAAVAASQNDWTAALVLIVSGVLGIFMKEKGRKK